MKRVATTAYPIRIVVDHSSTEIFVNDGEGVFTTRVFPFEKLNEMKLFTNGKLNYDLKRYSFSSGIWI